MKRIAVAVAVCILACNCALGAAIDFSPSSGYWIYDDHGTLSINETILVDRGMNSLSDALVTSGAVVRLPSSFQVVGAGTAGPYELIPIGENTVTIESPTGDVYFMGTLGSGDLTPRDSTSSDATGYTLPDFDISGYTVTPAGITLGSAALNAIATHTPEMLDFDIVFTGASLGFRNMLENGLFGQNTFTGSITIPEPMTVMILGLGGIALLRRRK